jgi:hypothetical protein
VDRNNPDRNNVADIAAALTELGRVLKVDEDEYVIEAAVPAHELPVINAMAGVSYVRCVFNYFCAEPERKAA